MTDDPVAFNAKDFYCYALHVSIPGLLTLADLHIPKLAKFADLHSYTHAYCSFVLFNEAI